MVSGKEGRSIYTSSASLGSLKGACMDRSLLLNKNQEIGLSLGQGFVPNTRILVTIWRGKQHAACSAHGEVETTDGV